MLLPRLSTAWVRTCPGQTRGAGNCPTKQVKRRNSAARLVQATYRPWLGRPIRPRRDYPPYLSCRNSQFAWCAGCKERSECSAIGAWVAQREAGGVRGTAGFTGEEEESDHNRNRRSPESNCAENAAGAGGEIRPGCGEPAGPQGVA